MFAKKIAGTPTTIEMLEQRLRLELRQHIDRQDAGVDEIRQHEIDNPIPAAKRHRGLRPVLRQWKETFAAAAGQYHTQHVHHEPLF